MALIRLRFTGGLVEMYDDEMGSPKAFPPEEFVTMFRELGYSALSDADIVQSWRGKPGVYFRAGARAAQEIANEQCSAEYGVTCGEHIYERLNGRDAT